MVAYETVEEIVIEAVYVERIDDSGIDFNIYYEN